MWCYYLCFVSFIVIYSSLLPFFFSRLSGTFPFNEDEEIEDVKKRFELIIFENSFVLKILANSQCKFYVSNKSMERYIE